MKHFFLGLLAVTGFLLAAAQSAPKTDTWSIKLNGENVFTASKENETANTVKIAARDLVKKNSCVEINYVPALANAGWSRSIMLYDENDNELLNKKMSGDSLYIAGSEWKKLATQKKKIKIYTISLPDDPKLAATVRVRRVHLCTLEL